MIGKVGTDITTNLASNGTTIGKNSEVVAISKQVLEKVATGEVGQGTTKTYSKEQVEKIVSGMNDFLKASPNTHLKFEFHDKLNEYYVTIVDENTKEIVREIPPKKMLDMFAAMTEFLGLMVDKKI